METDRADRLFDLFYWRKIALVLVFNALTTLTVISILLGSGVSKNSLKDAVNKFQTEITITTNKKVGNVTSSKTEKMPISPLLKSAGDFFKISVQKPVESEFLHNFMLPTVAEEIIYRAPIRLLVGFVMLFRQERNWWIVLLVWIIGLCLNLHWAISIHTSVETLLWIPVFFAGAGWLWLVIRTNRLWPAVFCHMAANLSVFFAIKTYQLLF